MGRIVIVRRIFILLFIILGAELFYLQIIQGSRYLEMSRSNCLRFVAQSGARGKIFDRNLNILASNKLSYDVVYIPQDLKKADEQLAAAAEVLNLDFGRLKVNFKRDFIALSVPVVLVRSISAQKAILLELARQDFPQVVIQQNPIRNYPNGDLASHLLGYVSEIDRWRLTKLADYGYKTKDLVGFGGVEEKYDYYLRPKEGGQTFQINHRGKIIRLMGFSSPQNGKDLRLTIDLRIQKLAEDALSNRKGAVVVMDASSGALLGLASSPAFNPAVFAERKNDSITAVLNDARSPLLDRAISASYAPGSVFKLVVASAGVDTGKIPREKSFNCSGKIIIGRREFSCSGVHHEQDLILALAHSCNTYFYRSGIALGATSLADYALKLGLGQKSGFELPYEVSGFIPHPRRGANQSWFDGDTANMSIGQGEVLASPLQIARMTAVFANNGYLVRPYIVEEIAGKDVSKTQRKSVNLRFRQPLISSVREGMRQAVKLESGTAHLLEETGVSIAGKTGTAQAPPGAPHGWFSGFFPYENPKYVICVFFEHGGSSYASVLAAKEIISGMVNEGLIE